MARTKQTAHKCTGGPQVRIAPAQPDPPAPAPAQPVEEVEEDLEEIYFFMETEDGRIMALNSEGNLRTLTPSPTPASPTPAADAPPSPPAAPAPDAPAPAAASGDLDDSGDDGSDDDDDEDDNEEDEDKEEQPIDEDNNNDDGNKADAPCAAGATCEIISSVDEHGSFPTLLQDVLLQLGNTLRPLYVTNHVSEPGRNDHYVTWVHIRERLGIGRGMRTAPHATYAAAISNIARRAVTP
jgi:hypothetical protein